MAITRFAPSPTGPMHIGGLRQALFSYALAKKTNGKFILRLEDTDRKRFAPGSGKEIIDLLNYFGLSPDLAPTNEQIAKMEAGEFAGFLGDWMFHIDEITKVKDEDFSDIFVQTQRLPVYQKYAWQLVKNGYAYFCFCSPERLEKVNKERLKKGLQPGYDGYCKIHYTLEQALEKIKAGEPYVVRMNTSKAKELFGSTKIKVQDEILDTLEFDFNNVNDQVLIKSDGIPTYHLAVVVDDHLMGVTHMMRGYEWISSTPKQVFLYKALGWEMPKFIHLPIILDPSGGKLSKRKGSVATIDFLREGYLKEALLNFLMLLGWAPQKGDTQEFFTLEEFIDKFSINGVNKANPTFNREKLLWFNGQYIRKLPDADFMQAFRDWLQQYFVPQDNTDSLLKELILKDGSLPSKLELVRPRIKLLSDALSLLKFFYIEPELLDYRDIKGVKRYSADILAKALLEYINVHASLMKDKEKWVSTVRQIADKFNIKHADLFMLIRLAVVGSPVSVPLWEGFILMDSDVILSRLNNYLDWLSNLK